jgi:hypothetical protein
VNSSALPKLLMQEIPYDHEDSTNMFRPSPEKPFLATPDAIAMYQHEVIVACLRVLQQKAAEVGGVDYLQVFDGESIGKPENLWYIEDGPGGAITALLPSNY